MATDTEGLVTSLYNGLLLRDPTTAETVYWTDQIDIGVITPVGMVLFGAVDPDFTDVSLQIAMMYEAAFGHYATTEHLMAWRVAYDTGLSLANIGQNFILSNEFKANNVGLTSTANYLQAMANSGMGRDATRAELDFYVPLLDAGVLDYGDILQLIVENNGRGEQVGLAMLAAGVNGVAPEAATIDSLEGSLPAAINTLIVNSPFFSPQITGLDLVEDGGQLVISGPLTADMALNLTTLKVTVDGLSQELRSGKLSDVTSVDAIGLTGAGSVAFVGSVGDDIYAASAAGDTVRGGGGDDQLSGGAGADNFVFEATAAANGFDTIADFQVDLLDSFDFSLFLNAPETDYVGLVDAESSSVVSWTNGDVLVAVGNGLTTPTDIAGLFGEGFAFAAPTGRGKAVVITADVVGDASIWYLVNQVGTGSISANEIAQVAVLSDINNLDFNTLNKDSPFYFPAAAEDVFSLVESNGTLLLAGPLTGDMTIDLEALTITVDAVSQALSGGTLSNVASVDATGLTETATVDFSGTAGAETYAASSAGDTVRGGGGNDQLTGGAGSDGFIFESTALGNGLDTIIDFQITAPDVLDFSAFLAVTGTSRIALVDAESVAAAAWENGDVLVVEGYGLTTTDAIAGLFGAGLPFAAPSNRGKAVVIATDIVGDAGVWYLVNQLTTNTITPDELTQVAVLGGINNLDLLSFTANNFA